jgi:hypothetical protein
VAAQRKTAGKGSARVARRGKAAGKKRGTKKRSAKKRSAKKRSAKKRSAKKRTSQGAARTLVAIERDVVAWFRGHVSASDARNLAAAVNEALRGFIATQEAAIARALRRIVRQELQRGRR